MKKQIVIAGVMLCVLLLSGCSTIQDMQYLTKEQIVPQQMESKIHALINEERVINGIFSLQYDDALAEVARRHSQDMAIRNYFSHYNPEGMGPTERAKALGYPCYKNYGSYYTDGIAENIGLTPIGDVIGCGDVYSMDDIARCCIDGWMTSPGHRQNILDTSYDKEGIGIAVSSDDKIYITEDFW